MRVLWNLRRAARFKDAARLLNQLAKSDKIRGSVLRKQIYVLAAMLADQGRTGKSESLMLIGEDNLWRYAQVMHAPSVFPSRLHENCGTQKFSYLFV